MDGERGWDHGVFIPMMLINPSASVPIVQLSVLTSESPSAHFALGRALSSLRAQNIAIIGSGFASLHNLRAMFSGQTRNPAFVKLNQDWSKSVTDAVQTADVKERETKFEGWRKWPGAYEMHPRGGAEHFLPLIVCAGAAGEGEGKSYKDEFAGLDMWSYYWE
ncbi:Extradiol ring-cleavage dioxygenase, class III enzyme, subunit B [Clohesyomyces aquaticus]|uniref:Extradiol ring-cleavage dioxygenase, class III enzyme, subunit B n=1 Tax=Clohesyomyces aquaticus TaxID=1231657 RepID=A0A1Y1YB53_9PLEO|nr:Extradiol ring-cleavage dioxygenase, class III enzyme, subunit B [Clohesyomyces aquaticus]